ncbi:MAG: hypothetical protein MZW92_00765 [Comamonadaceae bacterium]|nr:hypothetical protein [Comamonadaceae bacterium]
MGDATLQAMQAADRGYEIVRLPSISACNLLTINGTVLAQHVDCEESIQKLQEAADEANLSLYLSIASDCPLSLSLVGEAESCV